MINTKIRLWKHIVESNRVTLRLQCGEYGTEFQLQRRESENSAWVTILDDYVYDTYYLFNDWEITPGKSYRYRVVVSGQSSNELIVNVSTQPVIDLQVQFVSNNLLKLTWNYYLDGAAYKLQRQEEKNNKWEDIYTGDKNSFSFYDGELTPGQTYRYRVIEEELNISSREITVRIDPVSVQPAEIINSPEEVHIGTATGFDGGKVTARVVISQGSLISNLDIDVSTQTLGIGTRCAEDDKFKAQFVWETGPFILGEDVDVITGATVTSTAVVEAINAAVDSPATENYVYIATEAWGDEFVSVGVTDKDGVITAVFTDYASEAFTSQFIGKRAPFTLRSDIDAVKIDAVPGATNTLQTLVNLVNSAYGYYGY